MNPKNALTVALLLFVAACVAVLTVKALRAKPESGGASQQRLPANGVVVYYLHGKQRCPTCQAMEANTREAVEKGFADQVKTGDVVLCEINYESPGNEHYVQDFAIPAPAPAVVVQQRQAGKQKTWKNLDRAFELMMSSDKKTFIEYVQQETRAVMKGTSP